MWASRVGSGEGEVRYPATNVVGDFAAKGMEHLVDLVQKDSCEVITEEKEPGADFCNCFLCTGAVCMMLQRSIRLIAEGAIGGDSKASGVAEPELVRDVGFNEGGDHRRQSVTEEIVYCTQGHTVSVDERALFVWLEFAWVQESLVGVPQVREKLPEVLVKLLGEWAT